MISTRFDPHRFSVGGTGTTAELNDFLLSGIPCARRVAVCDMPADIVGGDFPSIPNLADDRGGKTADAVDPSESIGCCTAIADMPPNSHLEVAALASILGRCKKSIQRAVRRGELPQPFTLLGRHVWLAGKIVEHLQKRQDEALRMVERRARKIEEQKKGF